MSTRHATMQAAVLGAVLALAAPARAFLSPPSFLRFGSCSEVAVQPGLDLQKFAGRWFTVAKMPNEYDPGKFCINTQYTFHGDHMTSTQRGLYEDRTKQKLSTYLVVPEGPDPVLTVVTSGMPNAPLKIIATDYESYACLYTCMGIVGLKAEFGIILTRQPVPPEPIVQICYDRFTNDTDIDVSEMELIEQGKDCPYWARLDERDRRLPEHRLHSRNLVQPVAAAPISSQHQEQANAGSQSGANVAVFSTAMAVALTLIFST